MSTYNSKFSGAEIDELLEKTQELSDLHAAGQLGGSGAALHTTVIDLSTFVPIDNTDDVASTDTTIIDKVSALQGFMRSNFGTIKSITVTIQIPAAPTPYNGFVLQGSYMLGDDIDIYENIQCRALVTPSESISFLFILDTSNNTAKISSNSFFLSAMASFGAEVTISVY